MTITFTKFDSADYLKSEADIARYFEAVAELDDPALTIAALNTVARACNIRQLARDAGLTREEFYKALSSDGNPSFATVSKIAKASSLWIELHATTADATA